MTSKQIILSIGIGAVIVGFFLFAHLTASEKFFAVTNFHGSLNMSEKFSFSYPAAWQNDGQYFSPAKIDFYTIGNTTAPVYFDLVRSSIFSQTDLSTELAQDKRRSPDAQVEIDNHAFTRYDLDDYGSYGGDSAGHVVIYVGPTITVDTVPYILVFHWEEKPLLQTIAGNDPTIFDSMVKSLTFTK